MSPNFREFMTSPLACLEITLCYQELVLYHTVQGNKGQDDGNSLYVLLVLRIIAIVGGGFNCTGYNSIASRWG